mmetsp:Transcript_35457/g.100390  ORF Transcript_35457/g.100390 Transcript_35457/m.100390 type:complete len:578 (-) Transcript_35457:119-1852(-)
MKELHMEPLVAAGDLITLTPPVEMLSFDLCRPPAEDREEVCQVAASRSGRAEAIVFWWQLAMDPGGTLLLSTAPPWITAVSEGADGGTKEWGAQGWRDHWKTCWCAVGPQPFQVQQGDMLTIAARQGEINISSTALPTAEAMDISHSVSASSPTVEGGHDHGGGGSPAARHPTAIAGGHHSSSQAGPPSLQGLPIVSQVELAASSPLRIHCLRDETLWNMYMECINLAVASAQTAGGETPQTLGFMVVGDSTPLAGIAARVLGDAGQLTVLQDGHGAHRFLEAFIKEAGVGNVASQSTKPFLLLAKHAGSGGDAGSVAQRWRHAVHFVVGEPYYWSCEGLLPWAPLRFWHEVDALRSSGVLSPSAAVLPAKASLFGVAVALPELWRTRLALSSVEGTDLSMANPLLGVVANPERDGPVTGQGAAAPRKLPILPISVWQCGPGFAELTQRVKLLDFPFLEPIHSMEATCTAEAVANGFCHALLLYMEYHLHGGGGKGGSGAPQVVSGAPAGQQPTAAMQGLQLLPHAFFLSSSPAGVGRDSGSEGVSGGTTACRMSVSWDASDGTLAGWIEPQTQRQM